MKVIIGIDGSAGSLAAVRLAGRLLRAGRDEATLYYSPPEIQFRHGGVEPEVIARARKTVCDEAFALARAELPAELQATATTLIGEQKPAHGLVAAADDARADLIVVGARGAGPIAKLLLGSVSSEVVHRSRIPVLVVREPAVGAEARPRVLLAVDGSTADEQIADVARKIAWPADAEGHAITVVESLLAGALPEWLQAKVRDPDTERIAQAWTAEHEKEKQAAAKRLLSWAATLPAPLNTATPHVVEGYPAERILQMIGALNCQIVVLGARGMGALARLFLGSTSEKVLDHAPCSVLIVPRHEKP